MKYYAFDGCSKNNNGTLDPGYYVSTRTIGQLSCCSLDGSSCSRFCSTRTEKALKNWQSANDYCLSKGQRLCESQKEVDKCCDKGCEKKNYDNKLVWSNIKQGGVLLYLTWNFDLIFFRKYHTK